VDGKIKLICGLVWTLVKHYDISTPVWDGEEETAADCSARKRLLAWITNKLPELCIRNFTKDWLDGRALGALVDAVAPGLCPDWEDFKAEDSLQNIRKAMKLAQQWLGCEQLVSPEDMSNPALDEQSMMTYLSQFPIAKLKVRPPVPSFVLHAKSIVLFLIRSTLNPFSDF
jgi:filamin